MVFEFMTVWGDKLAPQGPPVDHSVKGLYNISDDGETRDLI